MSDALSFEDWLANDDGRAEWRLGSYEDTVPAAPEDAVNALEEETGSRKHQTFLGVQRGSDLQAGVFTLGFRVRTTKTGRVSVSELHWWAPEIRVSTGDKEWSRWPYIWFARRLLPRGVRGPFDCRERRFQYALAAAIGNTGGVEKLLIAPLKPKKAFLNLLARHYRNPKS